MAKAGRADIYKSEYWRILPDTFRWLGHDSKFGQANKNVYDLWRNPGGVSPNLSGSIAPLMAQESDRIMRTNRGQLAEAAGAGARSGTASSGIAQALQRAIERAGSRDIAGARRSAIGQSEQLRRGDIQSYLEALQFMTNTTMQHRANRMGQGANQQQQKNQQTGAYIAAAAQIAAAFASDRDIKTDIEAVDEDEVLRRLAALPVSRWAYKDEPGRPVHLGPMAQDFRAAFGLGASDKSIAVVDAMGVLTAAVKALARRVEVA